MESVISKKQEQKLTYEGFRVDLGAGRLVVTLKYDDRCGNGHNTFSITADLYRDGAWYGGGCLHEDIIRWAPDCAPLIKWHLCTSDGPIHYVANTLYHAKENGPTHGWVEMLEPVSGKWLMVTYCTGTDWVEKYADKPDQYRIRMDEKTAKVADIDTARTSAIAPDATLEQLQDEEWLQARLPALIEDFRDTMESLGFIW